MHSLVFMLVVIVGCGRTPEPTPITGSWAAPPLLAHVPDDSPYVIGSLQPMRDSLSMMRGAEAPVADVLAALDEADPADRSQLPPHIRALIVLFEELRGKPADQWWSTLGLSTDNTFVLYGHTLWPVLRVVIANPERVRSLLERMAKAAALDVAPIPHANGTYWVYRHESIAVIIAIDSNRRELIASVVHRDVVTEMVAHLLGPLPASNLATTRRVPDLLAKHSLSLLAFGYVDVEQLLAAYDRPMRAIDRPWRTLLPNASRACRADLGRLRDAIPRIIFAYRRIDGQSFDFSTILELPNSATTALAGMQTTVPALPAFRVRPVFAVGAAVDTEQLLAWTRGLAKTWLDRGERCEWFASFDRGIASLATELGDPKYTAYGLRGGTFIVDELDLNARQAVGDILLVGDRVHALPALLGPLLPAQAQLPIAADGRPIPVPLTHLNLPWSVHIGRLGDRIALAVGPDSARRVSARLDAPAVRAPLFSFESDFVKLDELQREEEDEKPRKLDWARIWLEVRDGALDLRMRGKWRDDY
ncbi:MAG: hypothetical protein AB7T06_42385 [Kofleriaceae bacterium]